MTKSGGFAVSALCVVLGLGLAAAPQPGLAASDCGAEYEIGAGDTLGRIAKRCGTTVGAILAANDRITDARNLSVGWRIAIPGAEQRRSERQRARAEAPETGMRGQITNGRWCALLKTPSGETYGLVSRKVGFVSGRHVEVRGKLLPGRECRQDKMVVVSELVETP